MVFKIKGFHTCKARGTKEELRDKVPFLSHPDGQWLGQGYYFWTDCDYWARQWLGKHPKVISRFDINLKREHVLDLVGSVTDQQILQRIMDCFTEGPLHEAYQGRFNSAVCVSKVLTWLREERDGGFQGVFPYWAVRAKDNRQLTKVPYVDGSWEELFLVERHQMCVYNEFKDAVVTFEGFVHPAHFMDVANGAMA
ncbi:hypothetical protein [Pseudomonas putida]